MILLFCDNVNTKLDQLPTKDPSVIQYQSLIDSYITKWSKNIPNLDTDYQVNYKDNWTVIYNYREPSWPMVPVLSINKLTSFESFIVSCKNTRTWPDEMPRGRCHFRVSSNCYLNYCKRILWNPQAIHIRGYDNNTSDNNMTQRGEINVKFECWNMIETRYHHCDKLQQQEQNSHLKLPWAIMNYVHIISINKLTSFELFIVCLVVWENA